MAQPQQRQPQQGGAKEERKDISLPSGTDDAVQILKKAINEGNIGQITDKTYKDLIETLLGISNVCKTAAIKDASGTREKTVIKTKLIQNIDNCTVRTLKFIVYALQNEYLDANRFLVWNIALLDAEKIKNPKEKDYREMVLLLIAFALRYGADPNLYVIEPNYGRVHILIFAMLRFNEKKLFPSGDVQHDFTKQILLLMCLMGSKVSFKATYPDDKLTFKDSAKANIKIVEEARKKVNPEAENATVRDFMNGVGYERRGGVPVKVAKDQYDEPYEDPKYILEQQRDPSGIAKNEFVINFGFLLDDPEYAILDIKGATYINFDKILKYNAIRVLQVSKIDDDENEIKYKHESLRVLQTIDCIALEAFVELVQRGTKISYFTMNRLLLKFKEYSVKDDKAKFNRVYSEVYLAMIKSALSLGVSMDSYQLGFIKAINASDSSGKQVAISIEEIYRKPLYEKACKTSKKAKLPKSVKLLAASIGIGVDTSNVYRNDKTGQVILSEPSKEEVCTGLYSAMQQDPETFKKNAEERLKKRIQYTAPRIDDYTKGRVSTVDCYNPDGIFGDPLSYNDATVVYYRDNQDRLFCFPANTFKDLRKSGKNPITDEDLPLDVQVKIEKTMELFKIMGIDSSNILPVGEAFKRLKEPDNFDKSRTAYAQETIKLLFLSRGLRSEYITNLGVEKYNAMLNIPEINMVQDYLASLRSPDFIFATFSKALYSVLKQDENIPKIPHILNEMLKTLGPSKTSSSIVATAAAQAAGLGKAGAKNP
jgi:hypothetical protein